MLIQTLNFLISLIKKLITFLTPQKVFTINSKTYQVQKSLGEGGFSFVYLVKSPSGALFALKKIRVDLPEQEQRLKQEIDSFKRVSSPHIIKLIDYCFIQQGINITQGLLLLKYESGGSVQDFITHSKIQQQLVLKIACDLCLGLLAFHDKGLAFRDLKPANILLNREQDTAILVDLGSVSNARISIRSRKEAIELQDYCSETVTAPYKSPELFDVPSVIDIDERTDTWSLGCTIFTMAYQYTCFDGTATAASSGKVSFPNTNDYDEELNQIIRSTFATDMNQRPFVKDIYTLLDHLYQSKRNPYHV